MFYITVRQSPQYHQMTLEELLFGNDESSGSLITNNTTNTRTYEVESVSEVFKRRHRTAELLTAMLAQFNERTRELREKPRNELYHSFSIPKKSGGLRRIDAPEPELMEALRQLKTIFERDFKALYHTSAFAYVKGRCTIDAVKRHQSNESRWFGKYDLSNFFGSTTLDYTVKMLGMVYPFSEVISTADGEQELRTALSLAFLNGGLPQGTPISPLITNLIMIPVDYKLSNTLRNFNNQRYVYTRYADDFLVSSKYDFSFREVEKLITDTLSEFGAPFTINSRKTRYGSSAGSNWNLGVMLNKDNQITVGHKRKKQFQSMLAAYARDKKNGVDWSLSDVQTMEGYRSYYTMVEGETIKRIIDHISRKFEVNIMELIRNDLR